MKCNACLIKFFLKRKNLRLFIGYKELSFKIAISEAAVLKNEEETSQTGRV